MITFFSDRTKQLKQALQISKAEEAMFDFLTKELDFPERNISDLIYYDNMEEPYRNKIIGQLNEAELAKFSTLFENYKKAHEILAKN